jgi:predicted O-methyltransferase YrrM
MLTAVANGPALTAPPAADTHPVCRLRRFNHWVDDIYYEGGWDIGPLRDSLTGHISTGGDRSACTFTFEGGGLILQFWSHGWSGLAEIEVDGDRRTVDLFGESPALKNVHFDGLTPGVHLVRISGVKRCDAKHPGDQIVFHEAIVYDRVTETVPRQAGQTARAQKPARFNAIYHAPGHLGWPERTVLYSTLFGARPGNVLIAGTSQGGAALIAAAALDDVGAGTVTCVDPDPNLAPENWQKIGHRTALVHGTGIGALADARVRSGAAFDFAFIDCTETTVPDWNGLLSVISDGALILVHAAPKDFAHGHPDLADGGWLVPGSLRLLRRRP